MKKGAERENREMFNVVYFFLLSLFADVWPLEMFCCQPKSACHSARLCQPRVIVLISSARLQLESHSYMKDLFSALLVFLQMSPVHIGGHESSWVVEAAAICFYVRTCLHTQKKKRNSTAITALILLTRVKMCKAPTQQTYSNSYKDLPPLTFGLKKLR